MDAIAILKDDHQRVKALFDKFEATTDRAVKTRRKLVDDMIRELSVHAFIEEQVFYPAVRQGVPSLNSDVLEAIEEHHVVKWLLSELDDLAPDAENFAPKVVVLTESVTHHVKEEEKDLFPAVRKSLSRAELEALGEQLVKKKKVAPDKPHPRGPSQPPAFDAQEAVAKVAERVSAAKDKLVDRIKAAN